MKPSRPHTELHGTSRIGWLRAAVLGANDGIVSTASLLVGVAVSQSGNIVSIGVAALVAGAMSMAAGEYVSVHSQADAEEGDLSRERVEHVDPDECTDRMSLSMTSASSSPPGGRAPARVRRPARTILQPHSG